MDDTKVSLEVAVQLYYADFRRIARHLLSTERPYHTLQATELVNDWVRELTEQGRTSFNDRHHLEACAYRNMRNMLVDHARHKKALKRGGDWTRVSMSALAHVSSPGSLEDPLVLERALEKLSQLDPRAAAVLNLRQIAGYREAEIANMLGCSERTVRNDWQFATAWLRRELAAD